MKISEMTPGRIEGEKGFVDVFDPVPDELAAGVRVVKKGSHVPRKPHAHPQKQIIYVIAGSGKITNGETIMDLSQGDFIALDANEPHYVSTEDEELTVFEVKYTI
ncbi:MAG: cupin domain-containing protein [Candidatus Thorarchaeota archaeon]